MIFNDMNKGNKYDIVCLVNKIDERKSVNNNPYCSIDLIDKSKNNKGVLIFGKTIESMSKYLNKICSLNITYKDFNGKDSYVINNINFYNGNEYSLKDFVRESPINVDVMYDFIISELSKNEMMTSISCKIAREVYKKFEKEIKSSYAAKHNHHNYSGGLLYHTYNIFKMALNSCEVYDNLNKSLLISAAALHDIGKIYEFDYTNGVEYSVKGNLLGHLLMNVEIINDCIKDYNITNEEEKEEIILLKHMVASHHGPQEYGSIKPPSIMEAFVLNCLDKMDANIESCRYKYSEIKEGEVDNMMSNNLKSYIYHPKF